MAIKRGAEDCYGSSPRKRRRSSAQDVRNITPADQDKVIRHQRVTRSQARAQQEALDRTKLSNSGSARHLPDTRAVTDPDGVEAIKQAETEQPSQSHQGRTAAPEQSQPVPLTRQALELHNKSSRSHSSVAMASEATGASDATEASINAYDLAYASSLKDRYIFLYKGKPENIPKGLKDIERAVFAENEKREPHKGESDLVRNLLTRISGEADIVAQILPKCVPLEGLQLSDEVAIATNQLWRRCLALDSDLQPRLTTPKPDLTIGWTSELFPFMRATKSLRAFQCPVASTDDLSWPLFTAEVKGDGGSLRVARLQNLHNAAIMLSNLRELMKAAAKEADFFDKIHVLSLQLTPESIQLSYYWASRSEDGQVSYYGNALETWSANNQRDGQYDKARRCIHNAIEVVRSNAYDTIHSCMADVEKVYAPKLMSQIPSARSMSGQRVRKASSRTASTAKASSTSGKSSLSRVSYIQAQNIPASGIAA